jgi:hypothetical protein
MPKGKDFGVPWPGRSWVAASAARVRWSRRGRPFEAAQCGGIIAQLASRTPCAAQGRPSARSFVTDRPTVTRAGEGFGTRTAVRRDTRPRHLRHDHERLNRWAGYATDAGAFRPATCSSSATGKWHAIR